MTAIAETNRAATATGVAGALAAAFARIAAWRRREAAIAETFRELDALTDWVDEPNGLAFSPDESVLYVSDTSLASRGGAGNHHIAAFDVVDGRSLANPRVFYSVDVWVPDGFRVDVEGNVWTSADDGIHVVAPDGRRLGRIPVPERTANCVFGGPGLDRLFITASTSLYALDVAARGVVPAGAR